MTLIGSYVCCLVIREWDYLGGIKRCGLLGGGMALLGKCVTAGGL